MNKNQRLQPLFYRQWFNRWLNKRIPKQRVITLNQRKIFIFPSKAGFCFAALLLVMLAVAVNYQNNMVFALLFLLASVFVVTVLHSFLNLSGLSVEALRCGQAFVGETLTIKLRFFRSNRHLYYAIHGYWGSHSESTISLVENAEAIAVFYLPVNQRGYYHAPRLLLESYYPFGLLRCWTWLALDVQALVYPQPIKQPLIMPKRLSANTGETITYNKGGDDFYGFKPYQPGQPLKQIHWPSYAKGQPLQSKVFSEPSSEEWVLDWQSFNGNVEQKISALCYWVIQFSIAQKTFSLQLNNQSFGPDTGEQYRQTLLTALALYKVGDNGS